MKTPEPTSTPKGLSVLITGGSGFLARALVRELTAPRGEPLLIPGEIRLLDVREPAFERDGCTFIQADVRDAGALQAACRGVDVVLHTAALVSWGQHPDVLLEQINMGGTANVLAACRSNRVPALVHTSTLDAIYDGRPVEHGDEALPYPARGYNTYADTKARAEQLALAAHDPDGTRVCALRTCGMWGERDPYHVSNLVRMAAAGKLLFRMGSGRARFQHLYVGNAAHAHLLAARSLLEGGPAGGQVYFVTDFEAANFFDYYAPILAALGHPLPPAWRTIPYPVMLGLAGALEAAAWASRPFLRFAPTVNRFAVKQVCQEFTFSGAKLARELGYAPVYSEDEAFARTIEDFRLHGPV